MANRLCGYYRNMPAEKTDCYAKFQAYMGGDPWLNTKELSAPFSAKKPAVIGVQFMGDLFHESITNEQIAAVFGVMAATPQHQYVVLTKRPKRALQWFEWMSAWAKASGIKDYEVRISLAQLDNLIDRRHHVVYPEWPLPNVIICASVENQKAADERMPLLLQIPARWRGVSVEPMLSGINIGPWLLDEDGLDVDGGWPQNHDGLDLAICGAETGPGKRNFKDEWALDLRDQCKIAGVPYFFKKDGSGNGSLCGVEYQEWI
jgi:protein gp37